jgi:hypothetical protein
MMRAFSSQDQPDTYDNNLPMPDSHGQPAQELANHGLPELNIPRILPAS